MASLQGIWRDAVDELIISLKDAFELYNQACKNRIINFINLANVAIGSIGKRMQPNAGMARSNYFPLLFRMKLQRSYKHEKIHLALQIAGIFRQKKLAAIQPERLAYCG